jgi:hypothetical protein
MSNQEMAVFKRNTEMATQADPDFDSLASGRGLPTIKLMTANSEEVKAGEFPTNCYALQQGEVLTDLGKNVDVVIVAYRLTALLANDDGFCSSHVRQDPLFNEIIRIADTDGFGSGAIYGPEFLVWLPTHKVFATFLCGSKTARNMAAGIKALVGEVATLSSKKYENKKYNWFGPSVAPSNVAVTEVPDEETLNEVTQAFISDKGVPRELASGEAAPEGTSSDRE